MELVAVCDTDSNVAKAHGHSVTSYQSFEDMLQQEQLDLVALCTPSGLHSIQAQIAAKYKVNVMTEKPMGHL